MKKFFSKKSDVTALQKEALDKLRLHFVFNSLNAIRYLIKKQPDTAYDMVYDLATYLRGCSESIVEETPVSVEEELSFAKAYARLEEVQRSRLKVDWQAQSIEGYVKRGSVYSVIEQLLKQEVFAVKEERSLLVKTDCEKALICVSVVETGTTVEIPIQYKEEK